MSSVLGIVELVSGGEVRDTHGPESYEFVKDEFHERVKSWLRAEDQMRVLDDDRICVLLRRIASGSQLQLATRKLTQLFAGPMDLFGATLKMQVHAGFAMASNRQQSQKTLMQQAGGALASARANKEFYRLHNNTEAAAASEHKLLEGLEQALDRGEFEVQLQPKFHAGFQTLTGADVLICWNPGGARRVMPDEYLEVAERSGLIRPITWFGLKAAINRAATWSSDTGVSVRLATTLVDNDELVAVVKDALQLFNLPAERLTLEVTEAVMADDVFTSQARFARLEKLRKLGVRVSLAEFGAGRSSLLMLRDLPADELKIDEAFIAELRRTKKNVAVIRSIVSLAQNFGLKLVAGGIGDEKTATALSKLGCHVLGGPYFGAPLPITDFEKEYIGG